MSDSETIQESKIGDDDVFEIQEEFKQLEKQKRATLNSKKSSENIDNKDDSDNLITGVVTELNNIECVGKVEIVIEYILDNNQKEESFYLDKPDNENEFNTDNKFVRIVNFFGDRKNDPSSLKFRDIWLEKQGDTVEIDVPDDLSLKNKIKSTFDRKFSQYKPVSFSGNIAQILKDFIPVLIFLLGSITIVEMSAQYGLGGALLINLFGVLFMMFGGVAMLAADLLLMSEKQTLRLSKFYVVMCLSVSLLYITGDYNFTYEIAEYGGDAVIRNNTESILATIGNFVLCTSASVLILCSSIRFDKSKKRMKTRIRSGYNKAKNKIKRKYHSMKGIEYVKT